MKLECINRVELRGIVGTSRIQEIGNKKHINFSLTTNYAYKNEEGYPVIETTWHNCAVFINQDDDLSIFAKGTPLHIEGRIRTLHYTDSCGYERIMTEVIAAKVKKVTPAQED